MLLKTKTINFNDFMSGKYSEQQKQKKERNKRIIKVTAKAAVFTGIVFLGSYDFVGASNGIDVKARDLYSKLLLVGKWIIIVKGAIDTINNVVQGDFGTAKKSFLGYLIVYMILNGLPWAMDEVDTIFKQM